MASFTDTNPSAVPTQYSATIDWGDGSGGSGTVLSGGTAGSFIVVSSHKYAEGGPTRSTSSSTTAAATAAGRGPPPPRSAVIADLACADERHAHAGNRDIREAATGTSIGTFIDINPAGKTSDFTVSINWGDGSARDTTTGTVAIIGGTSFGISPAANIAAGTGVIFKVTGSHRYNSTTATSYTITATVTDADGSSIVITTTATVPSLFIVSRIPFTAVEGQPLVDQVVGTFGTSNANAVASDFSANVVWGDNPMNTPFAATIVRSAGSPTFYDVIATHTYPEESAAPLTVTVSVKSIGSGLTLSFTNTATVNDAPLSSIGAPSIPGVVGVPLSVTNFGTPRSSPPSPTPTPRPRRPISRRRPSASTGAMGPPTPPPRQSHGTVRPRATPTSSRPITPTRPRGITRS